MDRTPSLSLLESSLNLSPMTSSMSKKKKRLRSPQVTSLSLRLKTIIIRKKRGKVEGLKSTYWSEMWKEKVTLKSMT